MNKHNFICLVPSCKVINMDKHEYKIMGNNTNRSVYQRPGIMFIAIILVIILILMQCLVCIVLFNNMKEISNIKMRLNEQQPVQTQSDFVSQSNSDLTETDIKTDAIELSSDVKQDMTSFQQESDVTDVTAKGRYKRASGWYALSFNFLQIINMSGGNYIGRKRIYIN